MECVRCNEASSVEPLGYCTTCFVDTKLEYAAGLRRLGDYLAAWAAFEDWLDRREPETLAA